MSLKTSDLNLLHKFKQKVSLLNLDIQFLKRCKRNKIFPNFIKVTTSVNNPTTIRVIYNAKVNWLNLEIKNLYSKQASLELQAMEQHLKITKEMSPILKDLFEERYTYMLKSIEFKCNNKEEKLSKKFKILIEKQTLVQTKTTKPFQNQCLVKNLSDEIFSENEMAILKKGLSFNMHHKKDLENLVIDIETNIQYLSNNIKSVIRSDVVSSLDKHLHSKILPKKTNDTNILKSLQNKNVFYLKADKSNTIVILNKNDYYQRVEDMLNNGPYKVCTRNPLNKFISTMKESLNNCKTIITNDVKKSINVPNPTLPILYCLPKIHKQGNGMRPIVSSINSPTYLLSKWLHTRFQTFPNFQSFSVKNRYEFIDSIKNITLNPEEYLVSFDVTALYPNVPILTAITLIKDWLMENHLSYQEVEEYTNLVNLCMNQNSFIFNGKVFSQINGTAMGNPLSCFIANIFMSHLETFAKTSFQYFPRIWYRYVDDVFAVFDRSEDLQNFTNQLNSIYPTIKFTSETEINNTLPFLDVLVIKNSNKIEFDIYRKPTHVDRYIVNESNHPPSQKRAAFNSMIYRLLNTPLTEDRFKNELNYIKKVAEFNGFSTNLIDNIFRKAKKKHEKKLKTTLQPQHEDKKRWISTTYSAISTKIQKSFKKHTDYNVSFKTINNLKNNLQNHKDKISEENMSGIYQISCNDCNKKYVGQTKRNIQKRFKEHVSHVKHNRPEKSAVAQHSITTGHLFSSKNLKILKQVKNPKFLNAWESYLINKTKEEHSLNEDCPIQNSCLLKYNFL